MVILMAM